MFKDIIKKTASWMLIVFLATNIAYLLAASFLDPKSNYAARRPPLSQDQTDRILTPLNLSETTPLIEHWWTWLSGILFRWEWGTSPIGEEVIDQIGHRALVSAQLLLLATVLSVIIGVGLGVYTASRQYKAADRFWQAASIVTMNVHVAVASLLVVACGLWIKDIAGRRIVYVTGASSQNVEGFFPSLIDTAQHLILPTISLVIISYAGYHMMQRTLLLDNLNADYVRTARAQGLNPCTRYSQTRIAHIHHFCGHVGGILRAGYFYRRNHD